jgi:hypothetical protein
VHICLAKNTISAITHPPISPDLAPYDFILFDNLKMSLKGRRINDISMTQAKPQDTLDEFTQHTSCNALNADMMAGLAIQGAAEITPTLYRYCPTKCGSNFCRTLY